MRTHSRGPCPRRLRDRRRQGYSWLHLPAKWVFHAVGPVWRRGTHGEAAALASCCRRYLELATVHDVKTIAFPAISTCIYGFPRRRAAKIAVRIIHELADSSGLERVIFCCFDQETTQIYECLLAS